MKQLFLFLLLAGLTATMACKGEQGDPGPAGVAGEDGRDGVDGQDGNANVKSTVVNLSSAQWSTGSSFLSSVSLGMPILTQDILDQGLVMVYVKGINWFDGSSWIALPYVSASGIVFRYGARLGEIELELVSQDNLLFDGSAGDLTVKVVVATADGLARLPDLDWSDYNAVESALNLGE